MPSKKRKPSGLERLLLGPSFADIEKFNRLMRPGPTVTVSGRPTRNPHVGLKITDSPTQAEYVERRRRARKARKGRGGRHEGATIY
jgi:hypothetical protein